jgi:hypothetical protein
LRPQEETRIIWADDLCIDQKDSIEKTYQVRQMRSIYLNAEQVVVWMDEDTYGNTKEIMDLFEKRSQLEDLFSVLIAEQRREEAHIFWNFRTLYSIVLGGRGLGRSRRSPITGPLKPTFVTTNLILTTYVTSTIGIVLTASL